MYLFTKQPLEEQVYRFFEREVGPLLRYFQELFAPPFTLDRRRCPFLPQNHSQKGPPEWTYPNFRFTTLKHRIPEEEKITKSLGAPFRDSLSFKLSVVELNVAIPVSREDPFWRNDDFDDVRWDSRTTEVENQLSFVVVQCGSNNREARFFASFRAKDIIQQIRRNLHWKCPSSIEPPATVKSPVCAALKLGSELCTLWRSYQSFITQDQRLWSEINKKLNKSIKDYPDLKILLKYYQVHFSSCR